MEDMARKVTASKAVTAAKAMGIVVRLAFLLPASHLMQRDLRTDRLEQDRTTASSVRMVELHQIALLTIA